MNEFRKGTAVAAAVLSLIGAIAIPALLVPELGMPRALGILALFLVAIWGSRLGVNGVHRHVFHKGQLDERGSDRDFV